MADRYWESYEIGETWTSHGRTVTESDVVQFARLSGNFSPVHLDEEYARHRTPFGARVAQRALIFSMTMGIAWQVKMNSRNITYGVDRVSFPRPVHIGDTIRVRGTVIAKDDYPKRPRYGFLVMRYEALNQRDEVVLSCEHKMIVEREMSVEREGHA